MRTFAIALVSLIVGSVFASFVAFAWTGPTAVPPGNNVAAPINVGTVDQIKDAGIGMNSLAVFGNAILNGASRYLNFGSAVGSSGYGFRDNTGIMEFKNSGGTWQSFQAFVCSLVACTGGGGNIGPVSQITFTDNTTQTTAPTSPTGSIGPITNITFSDGTNQTTAPPSTGGGTSFWAASGNNIYNTNTANVGIGTAGPADKLSILDGDGHITFGQPTANYMGLTFSNAAVSLTNYSLLGNGTDTFVSRPTGGTLYFREGNTSQMAILPTSGNVGIGTTNPSAKLDVAGQVKITGGSPGAGKVLTSDATGLASWTTPASDSVSGSGTTNYVPKFTSSTALGNSLIFDNGTNIGIGTTNPGAKLEVAGQVKITGGSPGAGKVLTSDASGLASWQTSIGPITQITFTDGTTQTTAPGTASCAAATKTLYMMSSGGCYNSSISEAPVAGFNCPALAHGETGRCTNPIYSSGSALPRVICQNGTHQQTSSGHYAAPASGCDFTF